MEDTLMEILKASLKWYLGKYGQKVEDGDIYCEIDGIRLHFDGDAELLGWYNPCVAE